MTSTPKNSKIQIVAGILLLVIGLAVFLVRLKHGGDYAMPTGGPLLGGVGAIFLGCLLIWQSRPRVVGWIALLLTPIAIYPSLFSIGGEWEEVISLYAMDAENQPADLRLWIVDRDDGAWVGMSRGKALEHSLDGTRLDMLRGGEVKCVKPVLYEDRPTVRAIHSMKVEKYAVARAAATIGFYPLEATETMVVLRFGSC